MTAETAGGMPRGEKGKAEQHGSFHDKGGTAPSSSYAIDSGNKYTDQSAGTAGKVRHGEVAQGVHEVAGSHNNLTDRSDYHVPVATTGEDRRATKSAEQAGHQGQKAWELGGGPVTSTVRASDPQSALDKAMGVRETVKRIINRL